jgi:hypothetical protein
MCSTIASLTTRRNLSAYEIVIGVFFFDEFTEDVLIPIASAVTVVHPSLVRNLMNNRKRSMAEMVFFVSRSAQMYGPMMSTINSA